MPAVARLLIKTSLVYLGAALAAGLAMAVARLLDAPGAAALWQPYLHLFVVGWLTQLIFGVAYWLFPRHSRENPFGRSGLVVATYVLLNLGLVLRVAAEPGMAWTSAPLWRWSLVASAALQWLGVVAYAASIWSRVKTK